MYILLLVLIEACMILNIAFFSGITLPSCILAILPVLIGVFHFAYGRKLPKALRVTCMAISVVLVAGIGIFSTFSINNGSFSNLAEGISKAEELCDKGDCKGAFKILNS